MRRLTVDGRSVVAGDALLFAGLLRKAFRYLASPDERRPSARWKMALLTDPRIPSTDAPSTESALRLFLHGHRGFAFAVAQIVEFGPTNITLALDFDFRDARRM
jgi:hypothetical protein